jgi:hypothetical protein
LVDLEVRHRLEARADDRIRALKDTGATNLPLQPSTRTRSGSSSPTSTTSCSCGPQLAAWGDQPARLWGPNACG